MPDFDHNRFFQLRGCEEYYPDQMRERPNTEIKVRIQPNQSNIPKELTTVLWKHHNMALQRSKSDRDIVIAHGIPSDNGFGEQQIMEVVRRYAPNAQVVGESSQPRGRRR